jgi:hypothetical protein
MMSLVKADWLCKPWCLRHTFSTGFYHSRRHMQRTEDEREVLNVVHERAVQPDRVAHLYKVSF